jgi:hypothetical protein
MAIMNRLSVHPLGLAKRVMLPLLPHGRKLRTIPLGLFKHLRLEIDFRTQTQLFLGLYETEIASFCRDAARRCGWMIDVGAGAGELALYFMRVNGPGTVFAFEPRDDARGAFLRNIAANGSSSSDITLSASFVGQAEGFIPLDCVPVDRSKRGFIKIDVDGAEVDVLEGASGLLRSCALDVLVEVHSRTLEDECASLLRASGFRVDILDNAWWRLLVPERRPIEHNRWIVAVPAREGGSA